jgi:hypothetical protein
MTMQMDVFELLCMGPDDSSPHVARFGQVHLRIQTYISALRPRVFWVMLSHYYAIRQLTDVQPAARVSEVARETKALFFSFDI